MLRSLTLALILSFYFTGNVFADSIEGNYRIVEAQSVNDSNYTGDVRINKVGDAYAIYWLIDKTGEKYSGIGALQAGVLAVGWTSGGSVGVVNYKISGNSLEGIWAVAPGGKLGIERLQKVN